MIWVQDRAGEIRSLQDNVLPKLKQQLAETKGVFKGKERKAKESRKPAKKNGSNLPKKSVSEIGSGSYRKRVGKNPDADPLTERGSFRTEKTPPSG